MEFGEIIADIKPIVGIVSETKVRIAGIVPHVASELEQINSLLGDFSTETGPVLDTPAAVETPSEEASKVLEESSAIAEERLAQTFPKLPELVMEQKIPEPEPLLATGNEIGLERRVYDFIKARGGNLSISEAAFTLGESPTRIKEAVDRLASEGRIVVQ
jgi:hypothetical protein